MVVSLLFLQCPLEPLEKRVGPLAPVVMSIALVERLLLLMPFLDSACYPPSASKIRENAQDSLQANQALCHRWVPWSVAVTTSVPKGTSPRRKRLDSARFEPTCLRLSTHGFAGRTLPSTPWIWPAIACGWKSPSGFGITTWRKCWPTRLDAQRELENDRHPQSSVVKQMVSAEPARGRTWKVCKPGPMGMRSAKEIKTNTNKKTKKQVWHKPWEEGVKQTKCCDYFFGFLGVDLGGRGSFSRISFFHLHRKSSKHQRKQWKRQRSTDRSQTHRRSHSVKTRRWERSFLFLIYKYILYILVRINVVGDRWWKSEAPRTRPLERSDLLAELGAFRRVWRINSVL